MSEGGRLETPCLSVCHMSGMHYRNSSKTAGSVKVAAHRAVYSHFGACTFSRKAAF